MIANKSCWYFDEILQIGDFWTISLRLLSPPSTMAKLEIFEDNKTERFTGLAEAYLEPCQT